MSGADPGAIRLAAGKLPCEWEGCPKPAAHLLCFGGASGVRVCAEHFAPLLDTAASAWEARGR